MCRDCYPTDLSGLRRKIEDLSAECQTYLRTNARPRYNLREYDVETLMDYFRDFVTWHPNIGYTRAPSPGDLFQVFTAYPTKGYLNLFHPRVLGLGA